MNDDFNILGITVGAICLIAVAATSTSCVEVGTATGTSVCSGDTAECGDHDESDNSDNSDNSTDTTD